MSHTPAHPLYLAIGLAILLVCAFLAPIKINRWRKAEGIAPAPSTTQEGNSEYKKWFWRNMPAELRKQVRILHGVGFACFVIGIWLAD